MSSYFNLIPDFDYVSRLPNAKISDYIRVKNFFRRASLREDIYQNLTFFTKYPIEGDDRPDNVAQKVYENPSLDWLILLANNITHIPSEWPMSQIDFDEFLLEKYGDYTTLNEVHHYETIEVKDKNDVIIVPAGLEVNSDFTQSYYDYYDAEMKTKSNITRPVTNYQYEEKLENKKREIFILKQEYLTVVLDDLDEIMPYEKGSTEFIDRNLKKSENIRLYQ
jgi:hypothetical protein